MANGVEFLGWWYDPDFDSVNAVFRDPDYIGTEFEYFAYAHVGQHGSLRWPPFGRKVTRKQALRLDASTVEEVDELYGDVPGVIRPGGRKVRRESPLPEMERAGRFAGRRPAEVHVKPYTRRRKR